METTISQIQPQNEAEIIAAIDEMQRKIELSFARMDEIEISIKRSSERIDTLLNRLEEKQAARLR